jgi:aminopeptidase N
LPLSESDFINLAEELALRGVTDSNEILEKQLERVKNPDRKARMEFVIPSLSGTQSDRDAFFESLAQPENREHEPWVLEGLSYLHHPLRSQSAIKYILPSLEMLEEIQKTGDIFFPSRWLSSTFSGHNSKAAAEIVKEFLSDHPQYPEKLREKILQSSDELFRSSEWLEGTLPSEF